jgi:hypothetical protein
MSLVSPGPFGFFAGLRNGFPIGEFHFKLPQQRHDRLRLAFLQRHASFPPE